MFQQLYLTPTILTYLISIHRHTQTYHAHEKKDMKTKVNSAHVEFSLSLHFLIVSSLVS